MELSGSQQQKLHKALLNAFPSRSELERLAAFELDVSLNHITGAGDLAGAIFDLIRWAGAQDRMPGLLAGAVRANPGNAYLRQVAEELRPLLVSPAHGATPMYQLMPQARPDIQAGDSPDSPAESHMQMDFVIVVALEEERDALLAHLPGAHPADPSSEDVRFFYVAEVPAYPANHAAPPYRVAILTLLNMGRIEAATATGDAIRRCKPHNILLVGIAGGVAYNGVALGDVLVSDQVVDYELQKITAAGPSIRYSVHRADPRMLGAAQNVRPDMWQDAVLVPRPVIGVPHRFIGPVATGDKVVAAEELLAALRADWPKLIGVEMEAGGAASAAYQAATRPGFLMVRGVSDLADSAKDDATVLSWRRYACDVAAAYILALLGSGPLPATGP